MTDRSIVTALEKCSAEGKPCAGCPYANTATLDKFCDAKLMEDAIELINHQEAMIDKLNAMVEAAEDYLHPLPFRNAFDKAIEKARVDAIKELLTEAKEQTYVSSDWSHGEHPLVVEWDDLEEVAEGMVGADNAE